MKRIRADQLLVQKGLVSSREKAQRLILAGGVLSPGGVVKKPGALFPEEVVFTIKEKEPFVSRGGSKLAPALDEFDIQVQGKVCLDVGASTGGFTDCLLQRGACRVYAVDVGHGQLDIRLREDPRVVVMEKTNARYLKNLPELIDLAVIDVSFISLTKILPVVVPLLVQKGELIVLVKPQFELSAPEVKKGVVREDVLRKKAVLKIRQTAERMNLGVSGESESKLAGPKGNREVFLLLHI
ncbi:MAG: TlyA family RNA methyltransferase [Deltaproteobacteria bacterium]|nr:TlyA family RNA methyltransferase [Deltaproteobacteria bacterium]